MSKRQNGPTIVDIARLAGVSFKTVSRVLNDNPQVAQDLRERVLKAAADLHYRPNLAARSLAGPRSYTFALLMALDVSEMKADDDWYFPGFLSDLQFAATLASQRAGYRLLIEFCDISADAPPPGLPAGFGAHAIDGVMVAPPLSDLVEIPAALEAANIPFVLIAPGIDASQAHMVATDEYGGACAMMDHLLALGHRRIAFVAGPEGHRAAAVRLQAYLDALRATGEDLGPRVEPGLFTFQSGYEAARNLLADEDRPTAIFCSNDDMAAGAIAAAREHGLRIPDQLSIVGFDDSVVARVTAPALTTVRQSLGAMSAAAIRILASAEQGWQHVTLPFTLVERASTATPSAGALFRS